MKKLCMRFILILIICIMGKASWAQPSQGTITMKFDLSGHTAGEEVKLWIPYPVSNENQSITNIRIDGDFNTSAVYADNMYQNPVLFAKWQKNTTSRKLEFSFHVSRQELIKKDFPAQEAAWSSKDYARYLAPTALGPIDGDVKKLADKITKGKTKVLAKARAIYDWTCENTYRNPKTHGCGEGNVCKLLKDPGGKCTDISSVFIALARASGVPSREVFGIRQGKKSSEDITTWFHCWAEFFLPGFGWVPVDPGDVRKMMLKQDLKWTDAKTKGYREYYWGGVDAYRLKLSSGKDLTLNPVQSGGKINYLMYPFAQVGGKTLDWLDPKTFKYSISFSQN